MRAKTTEEIGEELAFYHVTREAYVAAQLAIWNKCIPLTWDASGTEAPTR